MNQDHQDILREAIQDVEENPKPKIPFFNLYIIPIISILFAIGLAGYFILGPIDHTIRGQIASNELQNNEVDFGEYVFLFYNDTAQELEDIYIEFQEVQLVETSVCLMGQTYNNTYAIEEIFYPRIIFATFNSVTFEPCPDETIVMLHTHPYKSCLASEQDKITLASHQERNPEMLMLVMCESRRYTLYD